MLSLRLSIRTALNASDLKILFLKGLLVSCVAGYFITQVHILSSMLSKPS